MLISVPLITSEWGARRRVQVERTKGVEPSEARVALWPGTVPHPQKGDRLSGVDAPDIAGGLPSSASSFVTAREAVTGRPFGHHVVGQTGIEPATPAFQTP